MTTKLTKEADNKSIEVIDKVLINKLDNKSINKPDNKSINKPENKSVNESDNKSINKTVSGNTTSWYDTNKFNKLLTTIDNNNFNHKNKIGKLKFNDINDLIINIKNNTISEANTKKKINELNKIKKVETNGKRLIENQKKLLSLFDNLKTIFHENESVNENENENESVNENENESVNENENENENESDDEQYYKIKQINNIFKMIDKKSFKDQIDVSKKIEWLNDYWYIEYYEDNKETIRLFKLKFAHVFNDADDIFI